MELIILFRCKQMGKPQNTGINMNIDLSMFFWMSNLALKGECSTVIWQTYVFK